MKRINFLVGVALAMVVVLCVLGSRMLSAQDNLKGGTVLQRTELKGAPGWEAILVQRILPPGAESGKHTQSGNEIVYIEEGSVTFEAQGKPAVTLKPGEAFTMGITSFIRWSRALSAVVGSIVTDTRATCIAVSLIGSEGPHPDTVRGTTFIPICLPREPS